MGKTEIFVWGRDMIRERKTEISVWGREMIRSRCVVLMKRELVINQSRANMPVVSRLQ